MASHFSCSLVRAASVRQVAPLLLRFQCRRMLCSPADKSKVDTATNASSSPGNESATTQIPPASAVSPSPGVVEAVRNVKPPNADEYAVQPECNDLPADVAIAGTPYSQSIAYRMAVADTLGRTEEMARKDRGSMRIRYVIHTTFIVFSIFACFIVPGEEEVDDVTGDVYRQPPGYVGLINQSRQLRAYLMGSSARPERYEWS